MKERYATYGGRRPFTRRLLEAMLEGLGIEDRLPPSRFYDMEPIFADPIPPELFAKAVPAEWLERKLKVDSPRLNRGFWALNKQILRRHGLRIISYYDKKQWWRRFVPTREGLELFDHYMRKLSQKEAETIAKALLEAAEAYADTTLKRIRGALREQHEITDVKAYLAAILDLPDLVIEKLDLEHRRVVISKKRKDS